MILLQTEFVNRGFETSADTVYGLLVAGLALVVIALSGAIVYLFRTLQALTTDAVKGLNATAERLERIENALSNDK